MYTVVLCMVLSNHIFDQTESLESANDNWSNRQSSLSGLESGTHAAMLPHAAVEQGGGPTKMRTIFREVLSDEGPVFVLPTS